MGVIHITSKKELDERTKTREETKKRRERILKSKGKTRSMKEINSLLDEIIEELRV